MAVLHTSHSPTIGFARDTNKQNDPAWAPIFKSYQPIQKWLKEKDPDVMLVIYNDHISAFFFEHYSAFALGVDDSYVPADEGGGPRDLPPVKLTQMTIAEYATLGGLEGTYPYTLERSHKAYRINKFLHRLTEPEYRERFLADEASMLANSYI